MGEHYHKGVPGTSTCCHYIDLDEITILLIKILIMNILDMIIIVIMIYLILRGIFRGFFMEIASLAGLVLGIVAGMNFHPRITILLKPHLPSFDGRILDIISFSIIFIVVLIVCNILGWFLKTIIHKTFLGWTDRGMGALLAILKGVIVANLFIFLLNFFVPSDSPLIAKSRLAPLIKSSYQWIIGLVSPDFFDKWKREIPLKTKNAEEAVSKKIGAITKTDGR
ncbi:CvpA family protein [uncultured Desulfobacterium sp.]|uniref:CvpA family protein n=1 Tax=uncultured Desulfobacterium sp. TaxID=201089 RepID=A0A445MZN7_9BACT|nr:CvpA family protein [uncultured Desulfobacterium sp.]